MKEFIVKNKRSITALGICLLIGGITMSFQPLQFGPLQHYDSLSEPMDTVPAKNEWHDKTTMKEYDDMMKNLDAEMKKAMEEVSSIDAQKLAKEIESSLNELNTDKIKLEIAEAMKDVDFTSIQKEITKAIKKAEWTNMSNEVKHSLDQAKKEIEHINTDAINKELENAKLEIERSKKALEKIDFDKIIKEAGQNVEKAKEMLQLQKEFFNELEKDGLINSKDGFTIEYKDKSLYINGKKQSDAVTGKYRHYIPGEDYKITIDKQ